MVRPGCCSALDPEGPLNGTNVPRPSPWPCHPSQYLPTAPPCHVWQSGCQTLPYLAARVLNTAIAGSQVARHSHIWRSDLNIHMFGTWIAKYCHGWHPDGPIWPSCHVCPALRLPNIAISGTPVALELGGSPFLLSAGSLPCWEYFRDRRSQGGHPPPYGGCPVGHQQ